MSLVDRIPATCWPGCPSCLARLPEAEAVERECDDQHDYEAMLLCW